MIPINAIDGDYDKMELFENNVLFSNFRIDRSTVPESLYMYEVMHDDEGRGDMVEISDRILVNFWGTIISKSEIDLSNINLTGKRYRNINLDDYNYLYPMSLEEYIKEKEAIRFYN